MKLLFCEACGDLVVPSAAAYEPKWCRCNASCCWWLDPKKGDFACWSQLGKNSLSVIGLNNLLLLEPFATNEAKTSEFGCIQKPVIERMLAETDDSFLFKRVNSLVVRFRPGFSSDTVFAPNPPPSTEIH